LAEDVGQALPAETRSDHVEIPLRVDVELDAIRCQAGLEDRMEAASQVPSVLRGAVEDNLGLATPDELRHDLGVRSRSVALEERIVDDDHAVQSVAEGVRSEIVDSVSEEDAGERRVPQVRDAA